MKKKHETFFGFAVILLVAIFAIAGCGNPSGGGGDDDLSQRAFSVSGKFTKSGEAGSGDVEFSLKSDAASGGRSAVRAVTAESYTISGVLEDGDITIRLKGSYDPNKGTWSVSANSSQIIYTLDGRVDSTGKSQGSTATIVVKSGVEWVPFVFPITEETVAISGTAVDGESGVAASAQGWWKTSGSDNGYSWDVSVLLSPWKVKGTVTTTFPNGTVTPDDIEWSIVEIAGSGAGPYEIYYTWPEYVMTSENLAKAASQCVFGNQTSVVAVTLEQAAGTSPSPLGPWVYYESTTGGTWWCGFTTAQVETFFALNYWKTWASSNGVIKANKYGAVKVSFNNAAAPTSFNMINLVQAGSPDEYEYIRSFDTLAELKTATLVEEHDWDYSSYPPIEGGVAVQTLTR
jgi:hypothetical protein